MQQVHPFDPSALGTDAHLDALDALRGQGDVVELASSAPSSARRMFVALGHAAVAEAARHPSLSSSWGTGGTDVPEAGEGGVPFRAVHMSTGAVHASLRASLAPIVGVDAALVARARAASASLRSGDVDALAFAMHVQRAAMGPRFHVDDATLTRNVALVHRAAFALHDEPERAHVVTREVDAALVRRADAPGNSLQVGRASCPSLLASHDGRDARPTSECTGTAFSDDDHAWLVRFAWLTAFVTTELAIVHMLEALRDGALLARVREDVDARARFVDESLRLQSPVARFGRVATEDVVLGGRAVPRGARLLLSFAAANHDARVFARPRAIDLDRARAPTFAFGAGEHACVGAPIALAILRAVIDAIVDDLRVQHIDVVARTPLRSHVNRGARACTLRVHLSPSVSRR